MTPIDTFRSLSCPDQNHLCSLLLLEALARIDVESICYAPGSRSAPLVAALHQHPSLAAISHFDERGLAFYALGLMQAQRKPVAIFTTSGTAVPNLYPAICEANNRGLPLIVLTADRPPELLHCGANQAIHQVGLFDANCHSSDNFLLSDNGYSLRHFLATVEHHLAPAPAFQTGPIHFNLQFREPLYPDARHQHLTIADHFDAYPEVASWLARSSLSIQRQQLTTPPTGYEGVLHDALSRKGMIVVGNTDQSSDEIIALAEQLQWPVIQDIQAPGALQQHTSTLQHSDLLLLREDVQTLLQQAETLIVIGSHVVSKRKLKLMENKGLKHLIYVSNKAKQLDSSLRATMQFDQLETIGQSAKQITAGNEHQAWLAALSQLDYSLGQWLKEYFSRNDHASELAISYQLNRLMAEGHGLFLSNSLPIRLFDNVSMPHNIKRAVYTNRGASGIDGIIATAAGVAATQPTTLVIGDTACLHDLNSLALAAHTPHPLTIIIFNNDGGNIFDLLPIANQPELKVTGFCQPHGWGFEHAAKQFHLHYSRIDQACAFADVYQQAIAQKASNVIEVVVPAGETAEALKTLHSNVKRLGTRLNV